MYLRAIFVCVLVLQRSLCAIDEGPIEDSEVPQKQDGVNLDFSTLEVMDLSNDMISPPEGTPLNEDAMFFPIADNLELPQEPSANDNVLSNLDPGLENIDYIYKDELMPLDHSDIHLLSDSNNINYDKFLEDENPILETYFVASPKSVPEMPDFGLGDYPSYYELYDGKFQDDASKMENSISDSNLFNLDAFNPENSFANFLNRKQFPDASLSGEILDPNSPDYEKSNIAYETRQQISSAEETVEETNLLNSLHEESRNDQDRINPKFPILTIVRESIIIIPGRASMNKENDNDDTFRANLEEIYNKAEEEEGEEEMRERSSFQRVFYVVGPMLMVTGLFMACFAAFGNKRKGKRTVQNKTTVLSGEVPYQALKSDV